jgi:hypothetical protein
MLAIGALVNRPPVCFADVNQFMHRYMAAHVFK